MTYNNNIMQSQLQPHISGAMGQTNVMFQPGYANTNAHEVQYWNQGGHSPAAQASTYGMNYGGGIGGTQAMFQPGFANTNVQEVRQLNSGYAAPQQQGFQQTQMNSYQQTQPINYLHPHNTGFIQAQPSGYMQAQSTYQPSYGTATNSIFSPGFAGTNIQEVQQRNNTGYAGQGYTGQTGYTNNTGYSPQLGGSIFSPGFAGTNVQEVRQLNQGGTASAGIMSSGYGLYPQQQQQQQQQQAQQSYQSYGSSIGTGSQSIYSPGFAGTNIQEVRSLNNGGQMTAHTGSIFPGSM
ncbi:hypothetical protein [Brevibacillus choshinensis]|uniref:hypothetical protein n=1 Tax=Brevibacillus choshinensis TaxID=54911 RepID=UPI002E1D8B9B|nr:hypothetical protein [Brevibacillus choshinensis]